jgi:hypothetical protein
LDISATRMTAMLICKSRGVNPDIYGAFLWRYDSRRGTALHGNTQTVNIAVSCADLPILQHRDGMVSIGTRC